MALFHFHGMNIASAVIVIGTPINPIGRMQTSQTTRFWMISTAAALTVHSVLAWRFPDRPWTTSVGIGAVLLVATALTIRSALDARRIVRQRLWLLVTAFGLWMAGYALIAYLQMAGSDASGPLQPLLLFALRAAPWFLAIAYTSDRKILPHTSAFEIAQVGLFVLTALFLVFPYLIPSSVAQRPLAEETRHAEFFYDMEWAVLALAALALMNFQPTRREKALAQILAALLVSYSVTSYVVNHYVIDVLAPAPGSPMFLLNDAPLLVFIAFMRWRRRDLDDPGALPKGRLHHAALLLVPSVIPICVVTMAIALAATHATTAFVIAVAAMLIYAGRSILTQLAHARARSELQQARDAMASLARFDTLTGLANRRHFDEALHERWQESLQSGVSLGALFIDIDHFKNYNDLLGHAAGDECLRCVADAIRQSCRRESDVVARYGGEEFVVLLPNADLFTVRQEAERIKAAIEGAAIVHPFAPNAVVSVSMGTVFGIPGAEWSDPDAFLAAADKALYAAKRAGRNRVMAAWPTAETNS